jgi:hypothetical protein
MKEGGAKTKNLRILAERIMFLENEFKGNNDAKELAQEIYAQFKDQYAKNPNGINK